MRRFGDGAQEQCLDCILERKDMMADMEKVYKTMKSVGTTNIIFGILAVVFGSLLGSFLIVCGARLLHRKKDLTF